MFNFTHAAVLRGPRGRQGRPHGRPALDARPVGRAPACTNRSAATGGPPGCSRGSSSPSWPCSASSSATPPSAARSGGIGLLGVFGVVAIVWSIIGYYAGDKMVLAVSGAHQVTHEDEPQLFNVVEEMTIAAGLPQVPAVYVIDEAAPNAFATGRDPQHASIAVTRGLLDRLDREELQGVIAHEMSHIRNYDIRFATLVGILVGMIALIADFFLRWSFWGGDGPAARRRLGRRPGRRDPRDRRHRARHPRAAGRLRRAVRHLAAPRVPGRRHRRRAHAQPARAWRGRSTHIAADPQPLRHANRATAHLYIANPLQEDQGGRPASSTRTRRSRSASPSCSRWRTWGRRRWLGRRAGRRLPGRRRSRRPRRHARLRPLRGSRRRRPARAPPPRSSPAARRRPCAGRAPRRPP